MTEPTEPPMTEPATEPATMAAETATPRASEPPAPLVPEPLPLAPEPATPPPSEAPELAGAAPHAPAIVDLMLRPEAFFANRRIPIQGGTLLLATALLGISAATGQADRMVAKLGVGGSSWASYWATSIGGAFMTGPIRLFIGGAWFRARIRYAGAPEPDPTLAREIFTLAALVQAIPVLLWTVFMTVSLPTPASVGFFSPTLILATAWSLWMGYRGVRGAFPVSPGKARVWFLLVPGLFFAVIYYVYWDW